MDKKIMRNLIIAGLTLFNLIVGPISWVYAAEEIDAYCVAPKEAVPHGSTVALTIKFGDSDKSNDFIVQGPFKILKYINGKAVIVDFKRGNDGDDKGREDPEKPTLLLNAALSPKHTLLAPATESVTFTYFVKHKEGRRGKLATADREQQVDCSFTVQHEIGGSTTPSGGREEDNAQKNVGAADLGIENAGTLPTSRFYFLKEWRWSISRFFTFNSVSKAELELRIANEIAAEALKVQETKPDDAGALAKALENYTKAGERLRMRLDALEEASQNPNIEKLLEKLHERTLKHALLLNQLAERRNSDPYVEGANAVDPQAVRDNHLQGAVDTAQKKIQEVVAIAAEKDKNIEKKAVDQIARAENEIKKLESELAEFAINEPGVSSGKTGPVRLDPTPARISTNMTVERQTPKRDFGDRMKAGLESAGGILANAGEHLVLAKTAFAEGKFGEAFGKARAAEVLARNGSRMIANNAKKLLREGVDADTPRIEDVNSVKPGVPGTGETGKQIVPKTEERVFPETNNRTACDGQHAPGCLRGEILECQNGKWVCIGPATSNNLLPAAEVPGGYAFSIIGFVRDMTDAPAMTSGKPMAGITLRTAGPQKITTQTRADGSYTLSFINAPIGIYDVCITIPAGYRMDPSSGCESVTVRLSEKYVKTLELINNGNLALHGTSINYYISRQQTSTACPTDYNPFCGKDGKTYQNACFAGEAGVEISYAGECRAGVPITCSGYNGPMCGYDNKTYPNECAIKEANVMVQYVGECS